MRLYDSVCVCVCVCEHDVPLHTRTHKPSLHNTHTQTGAHAHVGLVRVRGGCDSVIAEELAAVVHEFRSSADEIRIAEPTLAPCLGQTSYGIP